MKHPAVPMFLLGCVMAGFAWFLATSDWLVGENGRPSTVSLLFLLAIAAAMMIAVPIVWIRGRRGYAFVKLRLGRRMAQPIIKPTTPLTTRLVTLPSGRVRPNDSIGEMPC